MHLRIPHEARTILLQAARLIKVSTLDDADRARALFQRLLGGDDYIVLLGSQIAPELQIDLEDADVKLLLDLIHATVQSGLYNAGQTWPLVDLMREQLKG